MPPQSSRLISVQVGDVTPRNLAKRVALVSDTHMPDRCTAFPASLLNTLGGADLILHAGDVGELWVLDQLGQLAPTCAVHGNDDTRESIRELPEQQLVSVAGCRILLWHSHYPEESAEMAARESDAWAPKLDRLADRGRRAGASVVVFGHTHIPLACWHGGILLVNPGALASGNYVTHQLVQTAAQLVIPRDGPPRVQHIDLARPDQPFDPHVDLSAGFQAAAARFCGYIIEPDMVGVLTRHLINRLVEPAASLAVLRRLAHLCWDGALPLITRSILLDQIKDDPGVPLGDLLILQEALQPE